MKEITAALSDATGEVQAQIGRADTKASILTGLALAALTGGTALACKAHLSGAATVTAVIAATAVVTALVQLGLAIRPDLHGNHGFVRWANATTNIDVYNDLTTDDYLWDQRTERLDHIIRLSRSAARKYRLIRLAVDQLGVALAAAALTAILTGLGW